MWGWVRVCGALFWVSGGEWGLAGNYLGSVGVGGKIFWMGGGGWG